MLRYLRENTGNWIIKFFLGIIVIVFVFLGIGSFGSKRKDSVATINDEPVTIKEYQRAYDALVEQVRARFGKNFNEDILKALNVKQQALDSLIDSKLILAEADRLDINVSDKELQNSLLSVKAFQRNGKFDLGQYKRVLSMNSLNPEIFEHDQANAIRQQKVRDMVASTVTVSDLEAENWYLFRNTKMSVNYLFFNPMEYTDIHPGETEIKAFYSEHKNQYKSKPALKVLYIKFSPEDYRDMVSVTDDAIREYYEDHQDEFKTPEKVEARHILIKLDQNASEKEIKAAEQKALEIYKLAKSGKDFSELARKYSQGPSKANGGYLGIFDRKSMIKPFGDKAFSMKPGQISKPVRTRFGWHIIQVVARYDASVKTLAQASDTIRKKLAGQQMKNFAYDRAGEAFDSVIDGDSLEQVALIAKKKIHETKQFTRDGQGLDIPEARKFAEQAFALPLNEISDVKQFADTYYLIKPVKKFSPAVIDFDRVKEKVKEDLTAMLKKKRALELAKADLKKALKAGGFDKIAGKDVPELRTTALFTRNDVIKGVENSDAFIKASFSLDPDHKIYPEVIKSAAGYYIIEFKEKKVPDRAEIAENLDKIKTMIIRTKEIRTFQAWMTALRKQYDIKYNPDLL